MKKKKQEVNNLLFSLLFKNKVKSNILALKIN